MNLNFIKVNGSNLVIFDGRLASEFYPRNQSRTCIRNIKGRKRYLEEIKRSEQFSNASFGERLAMSGALSPEQIARNKQAYGITE